MNAPRFSRIALTASVALFFTLVAFGNVTDFDSNWQFVRHVVAMDTTFQSPGLMWRAVTSETIQKAAYLGIIGWQIVTAILLWWGLARLVAARHADRIVFAKAKGIAVLGLTAGFMLYAVGFLAIAGEWFSMWQSPQWNGQTKAGIFLTFIGIALLHLCGAEERD